MKIILIHKAIFHKRPPVISVLKILIGLDYKPVLVTCGISDSYKDELIACGVDIHVLNNSKCSNVFNKLKDNILFRHRTYRILDKYNTCKDDILLWVESAYTIVALGERIKKFKFVLQIQELHENSKLQQYYISKVIHDAQLVFMPEYNRTVFYQIWYKLKNRPILLPNKTYFLPKINEFEDLKIKYQDRISVLKNKKIILYQGGISRVRMLDKVAHAVKSLGSDFQMLLVGNEQEMGLIDSLKEIDDTIVHINYLPAPDYLIFSTIAYIGFVCYLPISLNNTYCAPNKIYEYSAYSLPMIGNDIPGLKEIFEKTKSGLIVNVNDIECIKDAILQIDTDYAFYKENAHNLFDFTDNISTIDKLLKKIIVNLNYID